MTTLFPAPGSPLHVGRSGVWLRGRHRVLEVGDVEGVRRFEAGVDIDRLVVTPAMVERPAPAVPASGSEPGSEQSFSVPPARRLGHAYFVRGDEVVLHLELARWGPAAELQLTSPVWEAERPDIAAGAAALARRIGVPVEARESPGRVPAGSRPRTRRFSGLQSLFRALGASIPVAAVGFLCALAAVLWLDWRWLFWTGLLAWVGVGCVGTLATVAFGWVRWSLWRESRGRDGTVVLCPHPEGRVTRGFRRHASIRVLPEAVVVRDGVGLEWWLPPRDDANGPVRVQLRGQPGAPARVQLVDRRGTVLVELAWTDWFGGRGGSDALHQLCARLGLQCQDEVLPDEMPEAITPLGSRRRVPLQTLDTFALWAPAVLIILWAWRPFGLLSHWTIVPAFVNVGVCLLAIVVPDLVLRVWAARRVAPEATT